MGTFLSLHRKSPLLVSRWCSAWVFMWCSTFFSCSVFCERRLALLQTSQSRDVYLWNPPPPPFAVNALEGFVLHPRKHPYDSENSHYVNTETSGMHKKKNEEMKKHSSGCLRAKNIWNAEQKLQTIHRRRCWQTAETTCLSWGLTVDYRIHPPLPNSIGQMCLQS